jgi:tRNA threonylcarbamoyladenosine biosynthesis protein TsaE
LVTLTQLEGIASSLARLLRGGEVLALSAPLGGGKTTFVKIVGKALQISEEITSPSFSLYEEYRLKGKKSLFHFDLYRINSEKELDNLGFEDIWGIQGAISFIEWPERAGERIPRPYLLLHFEFPLEKPFSINKPGQRNKSVYTPKEIEKRFFYAELFDY